MREGFPIPQADSLVGKGEVSLEELVDRFGEPPVGSGGEVITDPKEILRRIFLEQGSKKHEGELEKSERDIEILGMVNDAIREYAGEYGRTEFIDLPLENVHILPSGGVSLATEGRIEVGGHATVPGRVLIERRNDLETAITAFHELWHALASYTAIQVTTSQELDWYRSGFTINSRDGKSDYFHHLDEALVGIATARFVNEKLRTKQEFQEEISALENGGKHIDTTREPEVEEFHKLVDDLVLKNKDSLDREHILSHFIRAQVTGNILPVARLIENAYGKGAFRKIGGIF